MDPVDRAHLETTLAYSLNTLFFVYLRLQGQNPAQHPVMLELKRIKEYFEKIRKQKGLDQRRPFLLYYVVIIIYG